MRSLIIPALLGAVLLAPATVHAKATDAIEVVEVKGIIDAAVERAVTGTIDEADENGAALVVLQIDSGGVVDAGRTLRLVDAVHDADVPVLTWVGPSGSRAENGAALIALAGDIPAMAPGSALGPVRTMDLRRRDERNLPLPGDDPPPSALIRSAAMSAAAARDAKVVRLVESSFQDLVTAIADERLTHDGERIRLSEDAPIRFHKLDLWGRLLHAAAQPSMTYLFLLLALVGIVFELFHPSTGPAGVSGLLALALSVYGMVTLGGSWIGFALIVIGVVALSVDLRYESIGVFTLVGLAGLIGGSLYLFPGPFLRVSPWVLAFGIVSMTMFMLGAMTRVLRDLRLIARGELEVTDAHPHPNGHEGG
jgi:membrane-bound serine protease (ClpP class)